MTDQSSIRSRAVFGLIVLLAVLSCVIRLIHLDADPYVATWIGYVTDEGRWSETARSFALFGTPAASRDARLHLLLSPGYQMANYLLFQWLGVSFWAARLLSAISGILIILAAFIALHRHVTPFALALGLVILGFEANMLAQSRMALPEIPAVLGDLLAFFVLLIGRKTRWNAFVAGLLAAVAVAMKATALPIVLAFALIILLSPLEGPARVRLGRAIGFLGGFAVPTAIGVTAAVSLGFVSVDGIVHASDRLFDFLSLTSPYVIVTRFFDASDLEARNLILAGAWFCSWMWFHRESRTSALVRAVYLASGLWAGWWLIVWSGNIYLPGRYVVHFVVPATIHVMAGLSLAGHGTFARIAAALHERQGLTKAALLLWLVLPSAIVVATVLAGVAALADWDLLRLSVRIALIGTLAALMALGIWRSAAGAGVVAGLLTLPILIMLLWLSGRELGVFSFWWAFDSAASLAVWSSLVVLVIAACVALAPRASAPSWRVVVQSGVLVLTAGVFAVQAAPPVVAPSYSIRDASRYLEQQLASALEIRSVSAASAFLENKLRYRELTRDDNRFDSIVLFEHGRVARVFRESGRLTNLVRAQTYPLRINPKYEISVDTFGPASIALYVSPDMSLRSEATGHLLGDSAR